MKKMTTKVGMHSATQESVTVARGQRQENTDRVKNQSHCRIRYRALLKNNNILIIVFFLFVAVTWRLRIQLSKHRQFCVQRLARAYENKNCEKLCYFHNLHLISFTVLYTFLWFLLKWHAQDGFSGRHTFMTVIFVVQFRDYVLFLSDVYHWWSGYSWYPKRSKFFSQCFCKLIFSCVNKNKSQQPQEGRRKIYNGLLTHYSCLS